METPTAIRLDWANRLRDAMQAAGLNGPALAAKLTAAGYPVSRASVGYWQRGVTSPRAHHQAAIAAILCVEPRDLFPLPEVAA